MATVSSHVLDAVSGGDARGIKIQLFRLEGASGKQKVFDAVADHQGRISVPVDIDEAAKDAQHELVFHTADYFGNRSPGTTRIMEVVVVRMTMADPDKRYHIPLVLSPHSYTIWWSG